MAPSGIGPPGGQEERRTIGLASLSFGILLFVLILTRGQQAAKEGNQELRNDTYWVLVSPLVFSGFGLYLLRQPGKRNAAAGRWQRATAALPRLEQQVEANHLQSGQAQQAVIAAEAETERQLTLARQQLEQAEAATRAAEQRQQQIALEAQQSITALEQQLDQARQAHAGARAELDTLQSLSQPSAGDEATRTRVLQEQLDSLGRSLEQEWNQARQEQQRGLSAQHQDLDRLRQDLETRLADLDQAQRRDGAEAQAFEQQLEAMQSQLQSLVIERNQLQSSLETLHSASLQQSEGISQASLESSQQLEALASRCQEREQALERCLDQLYQQQTSALDAMRRSLEAELGALEASQSEPSATAQAAAGRLQEMEQQIQEAQQNSHQRSDDIAQALAGLEQERHSMQTSVAGARQRLDQLAGAYREQLNKAREEASRALRSSGEIRQQLEQLLQGITAEHNHAGVEAGGDPALLATYREACAELGVLPGSSWAVVRATWRRNLKLWHPDQGGDAARWNRRNGAYELLAAWYAFAKSD